MIDREREPKSLGQGLDRFLAGLGAPPKQVTVDVSTKWVEIVGAALAEVTTPGSLRDGVLVVTTTEPAVADHLKWSEASVVARANTVLGTDAVRAVRARVVAA